jgi:hypothetical protein
MVESSMRTYFAAVAPPYPPPTTATRARGLDGGPAAHPAAIDVQAAAPTARKRLRRGSMVSQG